MAQLGVHQLIRVDAFHGGGGYALNALRIQIEQPEIFGHRAAGQREQQLISFRCPGHSPIVADALRRRRDIQEQIALAVVDFQRRIAVLIDEHRQIAVIRTERKRFHIPFRRVNLGHLSGSDVVIRQILELRVLIGAEIEAGAVVQECRGFIRGVCAGRSDVLRFAGFKVKHPEMVVAQAFELVVEQIASVRRELRRPVVAVLVLQYGRPLAGFHVDGAKVEMRGTACIGRKDNRLAVRRHAAQLIARLGVVRQVHRLARALAKQENLLLLVSAVIHRQQRILAVRRSLKAPNAVGQIRHLNRLLAHSAAPNLIHAALIGEKQEAAVLHEHAVRGRRYFIKSFDISHCLFPLSSSYRQLIVRAYAGRMRRAVRCQTG